MTYPKNTKRGKSPRKGTRGRPPDSAGTRDVHAANLKSALTLIYGSPSAVNESDAARKCGLSPGRINDILNKRRALGRADLEALAKGLKISSDFLLGIPGAPVYVAEAFTAGLEGSLAEHVASKLHECTGEAWSPVRDSLVVDGHEFIRAGIEREKEKLTAAWQGAKASEEPMKRALGDHLDKLGIDFLPGTDIPKKQRAKLALAEGQRAFTQLLLLEKWRRSEFARRLTEMKSAVRSQQNGAEAT